MEPTLFDIAVGIFICFCLISSLMKGIIKEIFALAAYITGYFVASHFNNLSASYLKDYVGGIVGGKILGFFLVFITISLVVKFIGNKIQKFMLSTGDLSFFDRLFGAILGIAKGIFIIAILLIPIDYFPKIKKKITADSLTTPYLIQASGYLKRNFLTNETIRRKVGKLGIDDFEKSIKKLKQFPKLQKRLPLSKNSFVNNLPLDDYSAASKQDLENLLKNIQSND